MEAEGDRKFKVDQPPPPPSTKQEHESNTCNNILETGHSLIANNQNPIIPSSSSSSQNPFLVQSDANNMDNNSSNKCVSNPLDETHSSPPICISSQQNSFHEKTNTNDFDGSTTIPSPTFELSNLEHIHTHIDATNNENPNLGLVSHVSRESSDVISMTNHEHSNDTPEGHHSPSISSCQTLEHGMNKGQEIQNPRVQVMERPNESNPTSPYVFPSHVFARNNTNGQVEWSTASNESLFSIYMGNMSFSSELACFKSCEMDKPGDVIMSDQQPNASPNNQPPTPVNKFNDISQRTAELHEEGLKVTEAKAAETMREVIMESSRTTENKEDKTQLHSDGSTKSYAFQTSKDRDKSVSSKGAGEKQTPQKKLEQNEKTKEVDEEQKSNTNASPTPNKWLSCFSCCAFCH
ncbi:uncharacterized protein LOC131604553 [Vicia villosa]|uniref:uncharacterized protein LOC131604553 n=1 Tax=Vicia villosa TaxID=3911 RepID=UPI00273AD0DA|nr:uncharacterized protein LOC131604553 [Vicia villosa]XP_058732977.1 uncharacterized protein LOC131604553 [Vicia villosa]